MWLRRWFRPNPEPESDEDPEASFDIEIPRAEELFRDVSEVDPILRMQLVDTVLVVTIALVIWPDVDANPQTTRITWETWRGIVFGQYLFKLAIALFDTPLFYLATSVLQRWIAEDPAPSPAVS